MAFFRLALLFCLLYGSEAESIQKSLQSVQKILNSLKDKEVAADISAMTDLKTELKSYIDKQKIELKEYIDGQINSKSKMKLKYDVILRGFMTEKKLRKQLEARVRSIETATKEKVQFIEGMVDDKDIKIALLQEDIENLKKDAARNNVQTVDLKTETYQLRATVDGIVNAVDRQVTKALERCNSSMENVREKLTALISTLYSDLNGRLALNSKLAASIVNSYWKFDGKITDNSKLTASLVDSYRQLDEKIANIDSKLTNSRSNVPQRQQRVAFSAMVDWGKSYADLNVWQTVVFSQVSLNHGNAYSGTTGEFTAPVNGVYVFYLHITGSDNKALEISMKKNRADVIFLYVNGPGHGSDSGAITTQLDVGDVVKVVKHDTWGERPFYVHNAFSAFTGFLLYAD